MRRIHVATTTSHGDGESFFVSMTDMFVGILFVFIIMLMFFSSKFSQATTKTDEELIRVAQALQRLTGAKAARDDVLREMARRLKADGIDVDIDYENGVMRLPERVLFDSGKSVLNVLGKEAVRKVALEMGNLLTKITVDPADPGSRNGKPHLAEAVFVEGHTDSDGDDLYNWNLSTARAVATYTAIMKENPRLDLLANSKARPVFSVAGYGKRRPIVNNDTEDNKRRNRRIDLRIIMESPSAEEGAKIAESVSR